MSLRSVTLVLVLLLGCAAWCRPNSPPPEETFDLAELLPGVVTQDRSVSVEFLTDKTLALCFHSTNGSCEVYVFEWTGGQLHNLSSATGPKTMPFTFMHRVGDAHILSTGVVYPSSVLYSVDLQERQQVPFVEPYLISASGKLAAASAMTSWTLYQLLPSQRQLRQGTGALLSVSEDALTVERGEKIYTETLDGKELGSFSVKPQTKCFSSARVLDRDALFVDICGQQYIADFAGKKLANIRMPEGNPLRSETNDSGSRLLFDHSTRHVSIFRNAAEVVEGLAGGGPEEWDNGEAVRVIDTKTGGMCFDWHSRLPPALTDDSHSDISPSGTFVAITHGTTLSFFRLPDKCAQQ